MYKLVKDDVISANIAEKLKRSCTLTNLLTAILVIYVRLVKGVDYVSQKLIGDIRRSLI